MSEYSFISKIYDPALFVFLHPIRKAVVKMMMMLNPGQIIDFCCGTGNQLKYLKKHGFDNVKGLDIDGGMVVQSKKGKYGVDCEIKDARKTGYEAHSFDLAMISLALHEKPAAIQSEIVAEMQRVLKPTGHLLVIDYIYDKKTFKFAKLGVRVMEWLAGKEHYACFKNFIKNDGLDSLIKKDILIEKNFLLNSITLRLYKM